MIGKTVLLKKTFLAGGTITKGAILKFGADANTVVVATAATEFYVGVADNDAASGEQVEVQMAGIGEVKLGGSVSFGNDITAGAAGVGVALTAAATIKSCIGRVLADGASGDLAPVNLNIWSAVTA